MGCSERTALKQVYHQGETEHQHETGAQGWCTGKTERNKVEREVGGGIGMGNTCKSMADSCQCMTKTTTILYSNEPPMNKNKWKKNKSWFLI